MPRADSGEGAAERVEIALAVPLRGRHVLVRLREGDAALAGHYEFPGGKIEPGEEPAAAARRELLEEAGLAGGEAEPLVVHVFDYPDRKLRLHAFLIREPAGIEAQGARWAWVTLDELAQLPMPEANRPVVQSLRWRVAT